MTAQSGWAAGLLELWFETLGPENWFGSDDAIDQLLRERFAGQLEASSAQPTSDFLTDIWAARSAILLFDQVPRNIFRGTAAAFVTDEKALKITKHLIAAGQDASLPDQHRMFVAMPLMHSEDLADQEACIAYFTRHFPNNMGFAKSHHEMIERFGRFPHRNAALGRETSAAEQQAIDDGFNW